MPQVPVYGDRQLRTEALRPPMARELDVSSGARAVGQALVSVGGEIDKLALRESETRANEVDTEITRAWNQWEDENRGKYTNQTADGYRNAVDAWWKDAAKTYGADLDPRAQQMVGKALMRRQTVALDQAGKYEAAEKEKYADSTTSAAIGAATVSALKSGDYEGEAARIRDLIAAQGARKNWDKAQRDAEVNNRLGAYHTAVVTQLAEKDAGGAQKYLEAAIQRGEIPPDRQTRLETIIKGEADNQFATQKAAEWVPLPLAEQLAEAAKIEDPQRREKTLMQVRNNYALKRQAEQERENAAADTAWQTVARGGRVPEAVLAQMSGRERIQLQEHLRARAERVAAGRPIKTDMATYIDVREKLARGERVDLRTLTEKIAPAQMEQLIDIQTNAGKGGPKQDAILTDEARIGNALTALGIDKKKTPEAAAAFSMEVDRRVRVESAARGGKDLTADEKQKIIDGVMMDKVYVDEWGRDPQKLVVQLTDEEIKESAYVEVGGQRVQLSTIPAYFRAQSIKSGARTEQQVAEDYLAAKAKGLVK